MAGPDINLLQLLTAFERHVQAYATQSDPDIAKDAANHVVLHLSEIMDFLDKSSPSGLRNHLNNLNQQQSSRDFSLPLFSDTDKPENNLRNKILFLERWNAERRNAGVNNGCQSLSTLSETIKRRSGTDLGEYQERAAVVSDFLEECINAPPDEAIQTANKIINGPRWQQNPDGSHDRVTAEKLEPADNITKTFRKLSAGGSQFDDAFLDQIADQALDYLYQLTQNLDPKNEKSLMYAMLGASSGDVKQSSYDQESAFANLYGLDPHDTLLDGPYDKGSVPGEAVKFMKHTAWNAVNSGFGINPNLQFNNRGVQSSRSKDAQYQRLNSASALAQTAADSMHRSTHHHSGCITFLTSDKVGRATQMELVRKIADRISRDERFQREYPGTEFDLQGCLKKVLGNNDVGYDSYLTLNLAHSLHVPQLEGMAHKLLSTFNPKDAKDLYDEYLTEDGHHKGLRVPRPASLFATFSIFGMALNHELAKAQKALLNMPLTYTNEAQAGKHYAKTMMLNNALRKLKYVQSKVVMAAEQFERPHAVGEFALARINPKVIDALTVIVPAVNLVTYNLFGAWNFFKRIPLLGLPFHIVEGVHGFVGGTLSFLGSGLGLIKPAKKAIDFAWSLTSPMKVRNMINFTLGQHYQVNGSVGMLTAGVTPYYGAINAMNKILQGATPEEVSGKTLRADLANTYAFFECCIPDMVQAARYGVGISPKLAHRYGVPGLKTKIVSDGAGGKIEAIDNEQYIAPERLVAHFKDQIENFYRNTYGSVGEEPFRVEYTLANAPSIYREDNQPYGHYLKIPPINSETGKFDAAVIESDTYIVFSDTYDGWDNNGNRITIGPNAKEPQKAKARELNRRDYRLQTRSEELSALRAYDARRQQALAPNQLINAMRPKVNVWIAALKEARAFAHVNVTEVCAGFGGKATIRNTPWNIIKGHKIKPPSFDDPYFVTEEPANNITSVHGFPKHAERIRSGPTPSNIYGPWAAPTAVGVVDTISAARTHDWPNMPVGGLSH
jgi:hypothetical protein